MLSLFLFWTLCWLIFKPVEAMSEQTFWSLFFSNMRCVCPLFVLNSNHRDSSIYSLMRSSWQLVILKNILNIKIIVFNILLHEQPTYSKTSYIQHLVITDLVNHKFFSKKSFPSSVLTFKMVRNATLSAWISACPACMPLGCWLKTWLKLKRFV